MKSRAIPLLAAVGVALSTAPLPLESQATLIGQPFSVCWVGSQAGEYWCASPHVAALATDRFVVGTEGGSTIRYTEEDEAKVSFDCDVDLFDSMGRKVGGYELESHSLESGRYGLSPAVAPNGSGGFVASWVMVDTPDSNIQALRFLGTEAEPEQEEGWYVGPAPSPNPGDVCVGSTDVATNAAGQFVIAWRERSCPGTERWITVRAYGTARRPVTPYLRIDSEFPAYEPLPRVGMDGAGRFVVLWQEANTTGGAALHLQGQRFGRDGRLLGSRFSVGGEGGQEASLAMLPDGSFAVAWYEYGARFGWFTSEGVPSGPPIEVAREEEVVALSLDRHGNAALLSLVGAQGDRTVRLRLVNRALVVQGEPLDLAENLLYFSGSIAIQPSGRLLATWEGNKEQSNPDITVYPVFGQILQARHDADACVFRGDGFACDTAGNGALPEQVIPFRAGEVGMPFLADWDGDGRADPCVYRGGRFACDTAHDGGAAEAETPAIGRAGDRPLLGDLDGDGKADPCVRRGISFLCDRARDGGSKDLRIDFGRANDFALLGDADGDGRDDPCVYRTGRFLCDTAHNGGTAEMVLDLRRPVPGHPAGTPLFGDLDGDGRDEACFATKNERTCGFFHLAGGQPYRVERLAFGHGGEVPLMGDLDAF